MPHKILSSHYVGDSSSTVKTVIKPEEHKSNKLDEPGSGRPNVVSYPYGSYKPDFIQIDNKVYAVTRTSGKVRGYLTLLDDYNKNGYFSQQDDYEIEGMKKSGENPPYKHNLIPRISDIANVRGIAYIVGPSSRLNFPHPRDTKVPLYTSPTEVMAVDNNQVGLYGSRILTNVEQPVRSLNPGGKYNFEGKSWFDFLGENGRIFDEKKTAGIKGFGIINDVRGEGFDWGYFSDLGYLFAEGDVHKRIAKRMSWFGLTSLDEIEATKRADILHEGGHIVGIGGDRREERLQGLYRAAFYDEMAKLHKGNPKLEKIYRALSKEGLVYAEHFSLSQEILDTIFAEPFPQAKGEVQILYEKFKKEAKAKEYEGDAVEEYIDSRFRGTGFSKLIEAEPSYKGSKTYSKSKPSKSNNKKSLSSNKQSLEEIANEADKISIAVAEDGIVPTYEGRRVYGEGASMPKDLIISKGKQYKDADEKTYERKIDKSKYRSMKDAEANMKEGSETRAGKRAIRNSDKAKKEAPQEAEANAETAEASTPSE